MPSTITAKDANPPPTTETTDTISKKSSDSQNTARVDDIVTLEDREHLLLRPDTLCGGTAPTSHSIHVFIPRPTPDIIVDVESLITMDNDPSDANANDKKKAKKAKKAPFVVLKQQFTAEQREIVFAPAMRNLYQEILTNALDRQFRDDSVRKIEIWIDCEDAGGPGWIRVRNDGIGVPVVFDSEQDAWKPTIAFSFFRSGSNFDDNEPRWTAGRNGYGCKATNVFSREFRLDTCDPRSGKRFRQTFRDNMGTSDTPKITTHRGKRGYTDVSFLLDFNRLGGRKNMDDDMRMALEACTIDATACLTPKVSMSLNGNRLGVKHLRHYASLFTLDEVTPAYDSVKDNDTNMVLLEVCAAKSGPSTGDECGIGFVNSLECSTGTHMNLAFSRITTALHDHLKSKYRRGDDFTLSTAAVRRSTFVVVRSMVDSPEFSSQTKEKLTTSPTRLGFKWTPSNAFVKALIDTGVADNLYQEIIDRETAAIRKVTSSTSRRAGVIADKYDAATNLRKKGSECSLLVTEGDSARALAVAGLAVVGRGNFGIFALKGKPLNVRNAKMEAIAKNKEVTTLLKILGLTYGKNYSTLDDLTYKKLVIFSDQDLDGSHIAGLIMNIIHALFPSVLKLDPSYVQRFPTPIVRATPKYASRGSETRCFYALPPYLEWCNTVDLASFNIKYFKGLGTSTSALAREYFSEYSNHLVDVVWSSDSDELMCQMFHSESAAERRNLLSNRYDPNSYVDYTASQVPYETFICNEVLHYSHYSNQRNIPSVIDGLKPGQRKALFTLLNKNITNDMKVAQLAALIAAYTAYPHGEQSMVEAVVGMAQDHVSLSNINFFRPEGQFGSRLDPPSVHSAARYIFTGLDEVTRAVYPSTDDAVLRYHVDEGQSIEPVVYVPVIPMVLVNGAFGIGTGWSTSVPMYNPMELIAVCREWVSGGGDDAIRRMCEPTVLKPWYEGFLGTIEMIEKEGDKIDYLTRGKMTVGDNGDVHITELPVGVWTNNFVQTIQRRFIGGGSNNTTTASTSTTTTSSSSSGRSRSRKKTTTTGLVKYIDKNWTDSSVDMVLHCDPEKIKDMGGPDALWEALGMQNEIKTRNMHLYSPDNVLTHYSNVTDIVRAHAEVRLDLYEKRRRHLIWVLENEMRVLENKQRFIEGVLEGTIVLHRLSDTEVTELLTGAGFDQLPDFGYLLSLTYRATTASRLEKLGRELRHTSDRLNILRKQTPQELWQHDLDTLEQELVRFRERKRVRYACTNNTATTAAAGKKRKSINVGKASGKKRPRVLK